MAKVEITNDWIIPANCTYRGAIVRISHDSTVNALLEKARMPTSWLCGYVGVDQLHPLFGLRYNAKTPLLRHTRNRVINAPIGKRNAIDLFLMHFDPSEDWSLAFCVDVHGSSTYSDQSNHYPVPNSDLWWFGFDCNHVDDMEAMGGTTKDASYVKAEIESLSNQLDVIGREAVATQSENN